MYCKNLEVDGFKLKLFDKKSWSYRGSNSDQGIQSPLC